MSPEISVVLSVHNGAEALAETIESVLEQDFHDFELIVVNDGSMDESPIIAEQYCARDARVRVVHLRWVGLTRALAAGCDMARGAFIARQDCGDTSLKSRLRLQRALFDGASDIVLSSVGTRFFGPAGEMLYDVSQTTKSLRAGLSARVASQVHGPSHHGATMFRRRAYAEVGGYRSEFAVAQDLDLWMRLKEIGTCVATPEILYAAKLSRGSISHLRRNEQLAATGTIVDCANARRGSGNERDVLEECRRRQPETHVAADAALRDAAFFHFIGGVLRKHDPARARAYYARALCCSFLRPSTLLRLLTTVVAEALTSRLLRRV